MMDVGSVASRWRGFGLRRTFSSVPENDHLSEFQPFCLSERESIDGWNNTCENGGGRHVHSWNKSTSRLRARQSPEKQLIRSGQMTPAPRLWHGTTPDSERRLHSGWPEEMTFSADACFAWTFSGSVSGIEIVQVVVVIAM
jgi:hypothetical protein